jgi:hypothetical protein
MLKYRYPGANPFSTEENAIFYGRERDVKKLLRRIQLAKVVVLHSKSGLGKSSLINAGVIPCLVEDGTWKPIRIRFGAFSPENPEAPVAKTNQFLDPDDKKRTFLDELLPEDASLWRYLKKRQITADSQQGYLLIFDQFEELFTYPADQIRAFAHQLAELQGTAIPQRFLEKAMQKEDLEESAIRLLHLEPEVRVLLAIRSDRLHLLGDLSTIMSGILSNLYELKPLHRDQAEDAILKPAYNKDVEFYAPPFDMEDKAIEQILDYLTRGRQNDVEPFQLQIICQHLEQKVIRENLSVITTDDLGDMNQLFENYYHDQIVALGPEEEQRRARILIEEGLVFVEEERRLSLYEGQIEKTYAVDKELLSKLIDSRLLRAEPSPKGGYTYELSHDTLVRPVLKSRSRRKEEEARLAAEQARREREAALADERRKRKRATRWAILGAVFATVATAGMIISFIFYQHLDRTQQILKAEQKNLMAVRDSLAKNNLDLTRKDSINQSLIDEMKRWGKFAVILSKDRVRGGSGADYEMWRFREMLGIGDVSLVEYEDSWYNAVIVDNPGEAFERLPKLIQTFKNGSRMLPPNAGLPWIKWFYGLESKEDDYDETYNQNTSGVVYESIEPNQ